MRDFLNDIIDILASYFFDKSVFLDNVQFRSASEKDEDLLFESEIFLRHDIAYGRLLISLFDELNKNISSKPERYKTFSELPLRGELDIDKYLQRRYGSQNEIRFYPVIRRTSVPNTPENILIKSIMMLMMRRLAKYQLKQTAEMIAVQQLLNWLHIMLASWPWDLILASNNLERTYLDSKRRVAKRQTGNNIGYNKMLSWFEDWRMPFNKPGKQQQERLISHLLAFPTGDSFNEKVFEIWCMKFISDVLTSIRFNHVVGPKPLYKKNQEPIFIFERSGKLIQIWFQKQAPMGSPGWFYTDNYKGLKGIPDIILTQVGLDTPLVIDAKLRNYSRSKSEEVYKMLGYYENFRGSLGDRFAGALLFVSESHEMHELENHHGSRVSVLSVPKTKYHRFLFLYRWPA